MILAWVLFHTAVFHPWADSVQVQSQQDRNSSMVVRNNRRSSVSSTFF